MKKHNNYPVKNVIILIVLLITTCFLAEIILFLLLGIPQPPFVYNLGSVMVPYTGVHLTYIGFILPLGISILFFLIYAQTSHKLNLKIMLAFATVMLILAILLYFVPSLQYIEKGVGSHQSIIIFIVSLFWLIAIILKDRNAGLLLSYPIFFLAGVITDIDSLAIFKSLYFGGAFLYDGDFLFPLLFFDISFWLWIIRRKV